MNLRKGPPTDSQWLSIINLWLEQGGELLISFTPAGCGGSTSYFFISNIDDICDLVDRSPDAARFCVYKSHSLSLKGAVNNSFIEIAKQRLSCNSNFLLISLEIQDFSEGYNGYTGRNHEELEEYLHDCVGENVVLGLDPDDTCFENEIIIAYKGGLIGAY